MEEIIGTMSVVQSAATFDQPSIHQSLIGIAYGLFDGVKVMAISSPCPDVALAFVAAQTLECSLKAYIAKISPDETSITKDQHTRHNLNKLWSMAFERGLNIHECPPTWVGQLSVLHNDPFFIRYAKGVHGLTLVPAEPMTSELAELLNIVATNIK